MRNLLRPPNYRHVLPDIVIFVFSIYASLFLRVGQEGWAPFFSTLNRFLVIFVVLRLCTLIGMGVYDIIWRYFSLDDAMKVARAGALSSLLIIAATYLIDIGRLPRSVFLIDLMLVTSLLLGVRIMRRVVFEGRSHRSVEEQGRLTLIYGAGRNGRSLAQRFGVNPQLGINVLGFIDDDPRKDGRMIGGIRVLGTRVNLSKILETVPIKDLVIGTRKLRGEELRQVIQIARSHGVRTRTAADARDTVIKEVELSDLLSRSQSQIDLTAVRALVRNKPVLITGAGGSIGGELARQILALQPSRLLLLDHSEYSLYTIDNELKALSSEPGIVVPLLADIKDRAMLDQILREHLPKIVFHAAAYKHVHLVESNPCAAILNNVLGTRNLLEVCESHKVEAFVQISTDKAVNPVGVMGATKRACELLVTDSANRTSNRYCSVRFGNVLGSSGSLIPLLQSQIRRGEPVTITHQDMTRYFMLIPEAVSLVLKAASIAEPGDISILRMGEPVRIVDVAKSLIALMGKSEEEVPIIFTGARPGEKMFEELYLCGNELKTEHPDILILPRGDTVSTEGAAPGTLDQHVNVLLELAQQGDRNCLTALRDLIRFPATTSAAGEASVESLPTFH